MIPNQFQSIYLLVKILNTREKLYEKFDANFFGIIQDLIASSFENTTISLHYLMK